MANTPIVSIEVLGSGCAKCKHLYEQTKAAAQELGLQTEVLYTTDIEKIIAMGVMSSPVLAVNGKPVLVGMVPAIHAIKELLVEQNGQEDDTKGCCSDKDHCDLSCSPKKKEESGGCCCGSC